MCAFLARKITFYTVAIRRMRQSASRGDTNRERADGFRRFEAFAVALVFLRAPMRTHALRNDLLLARVHALVLFVCVRRQCSRHAPSSTSRATFASPRPCFALAGIGIRMPEAACVGARIARDPDPRTAGFLDAAHGGACARISSFSGAYPLCRNSNTSVLAFAPSWARNAF